MSEILNSSMSIYMIGLVIVSILLSSFSIWYVFQLNSKMKDLFMGEKGENLEEKILLCLKKVNETSGTNDAIIRKLREIKKYVDLSLKKKALLRYNPFNEVGSNQSFSLCLLDSRNDGVIISGLYQRGITNMYLKEVLSGEAKNNLSEEESIVLEQAINNN